MTDHVLEPTPAPNCHIAAVIRAARRVASLVVWTVVAVLIVRTWFVEGVIFPRVVSSGSMAETLLGPHREVVCDDCGHRFVCDADDHATRPRAVCPNCGYAENDLECQPTLAGDRVFLDKAIFSIRSPRRWEVVAFRDPQRADRVDVKRVVGLPGETVELSEGDVYVDGHIQRKPLATQRAMAVPVHDAASAPRADGARAERWRADRPETSWKADDGHFIHPEVPTAKSVDWLTYHHVSRIGGQARPCPVSDVDGYNQSRPRRVEDTHDVTDLLLSFRVVRASGSGELHVRATDGAERFDVTICPSRRRFDARRHGANSIAKGEVKIGSEPFRVDVSLVDRQWCVAVDRRVLVAMPYGPSRDVRRPSDRPFSIGSRGLNLEIDQLTLLRDVYYGRPIGAGRGDAPDRPVRLGQDEYYVLGDNAPISEDSRSWAHGPAVPGGLLLGKPFLVPFALREVHLGPWHFPVPDPTRMRYIR